MTADEIRKELKTVKEQQEKLVFDDFSHDTAWELGSPDGSARAGSGKLPK